MCSQVHLFRDVSKHDKFCIKNEEVCIENEELCMTKEELCIKKDEFCRELLKLTELADGSEGVCLLFPSRNDDE